jgi:hypothetical protein
MENIELLAAVDWRVASPFAPDTTSSAEATDLLARCVGTQLRDLAGSFGPLPEDYVLCTTILSPWIDRDPLRSEALLGTIAATGGRRPKGLIRAYECSTWGFALRFFSRHSAARRVMLTIVDIELPEYSFLSTFPLWGKSGFGLTTLVLELPQQSPVGLTVGSTEPPRIFVDFARTMRRHREAHGLKPTFLTFMRADMWYTIERIIGSEGLGPNRNDEHGHCFGSDPWIGIVEWLQQDPLTESRVVTAAAVAYNGYFAMADILVSPATLGELRFLSGDHPMLTRATAAA